MQNGGPAADERNQMQHRLGDATPSSKPHLHDPGRFPPQASSSKPREALPTTVPGVVTRRGLGRVAGRSPPRTVETPPRTPPQTESASSKRHMAGMAWSLHPSPTIVVLEVILLQCSRAPSCSRTPHSVMAGATPRRIEGCGGENPACHVPAMSHGLTMLKSHYFVGCNDHAPVPS